MRGEEGASVPAARPPSSSLGRSQVRIPRAWERGQETRLWMRPRLCAQGRSHPLSNQVCGSQGFLSQGCPRLMRHLSTHDAWHY